MRATFKLLNSYFWKTIYGPIIAFFFPVLLLLILGHIMRIEYIYPGILALAMMFIGVLALPLALMELKASSLFKYIGTSPVNPTKFSFVVIAYYLFIATIAATLLTLTTMIFFWHDVHGDGLFKNGILAGFATFKSFIMFILANAIHLALSIIVGIVIATFSKTAQQALTISIIIIIPSMFLSGMIITVDIIAQSKAMQWISRLIPFRYSTGNMVIASTPLNQTGDLLERLTISEKRIIFDIRGHIAKADIGHEIDWSNATNDFRNKLPGLYDGSGLKDGYIAQLGDTNKTYYWLSKVSNGSTSPTIGSFKSLNNAYDIRSWQNTIVHTVNGVKSLPEGFFNGGDQKLYQLIFTGKTFNEMSGSSNNLFDWAHSWSAYRVPQIENIKGFLISFLKGDGHAPNSTDKYLKLKEYIDKGNFSWLRVFFKQTNVLYTSAERALNIFLPLIAIGGGYWIKSKYFTWSSR